MLTAYWDLGLQIKDLPTEDPRVPMFPLERHDLAESMGYDVQLAGRSNDLLGRRDVVPRTLFNFTDRPKTFG